VRFQIGLVPSSVSCKVVCFLHCFFIIFLEAFIAIALDNSHSGPVIDRVVISDLRFADDIVLLSENVST